ncbi:MAG: SWIM zinc finger family protein, partial [Streptosporangiaceae bacterium]
MTVPFTETDLRRVAAPRSFERGLGYVDSISRIDVSRERATTTVYGSHAYFVSLTWAGGVLDGACTCPHGEEGFFCKHCVALGLNLLTMGDDLVGAAEAKRSALEDWLRSLSHEELVAELRVVIDDNPELRQRYELRMASSSGEVESIRRSVNELLDFEYGTQDYSGRITAAAIAIRGLVEAGKAEDAVGLAEEALDLLADNFEMVDESRDWVAEHVYDLFEAHLVACKAAPPDVEDLADYLGDLLLRDDYGVVPDVEEYADLLGEDGMQIVHAVIADTFDREPGNWMARSWLEAQARADGDVDALIAVYATSPNSHMYIVRELDNAGRHAEALTWAERGIRESAFPDDGLVNYVADRYASDGRDGDVLELRRARFAARRSLANYRALRQAAQAGGDWPAEREAALALLRADAVGVQGPVLIDVLIDDGDIDAAWSTAPGVATDAQLVRLADASIDVRPADALAVYLNAIAPLYQLLGDDVYRRMATLLLSARACHEALGSLDEFRRYVAVIRTDLKRKRNLMRIL